MAEPIVANQQTDAVVARRGLRYSHWWVAGFSMGLVLFLFPDTPLPASLLGWCAGLGAATTLLVLRPIRRGSWLQMYLWIMLSGQVLLKLVGTYPAHTFLQFWQATFAYMLGGVLPALAFRGRIKACLFAPAKSAPAEDRAA